MKLSDLLQQRLASREHSARVAAIIPHQTDKVLVRFGSGPGMARITLAVTGNEITVIEPALEADLLELQPEIAEATGERLFTEAEVAQAVETALYEAEAGLAEAFEERVKAAVDERLAALTVAPAPELGDGGVSEGDEGKPSAEVETAASGDASEPAKKTRKAKAKTE